MKKFTYYLKQLLPLNYWSKYKAELLERFKQLRKEEQKELIKMMKENYYGQDNKMAIANN